MSQPAEFHDLSNPEDLSILDEGYLQHWKDMAGDDLEPFLLSLTEDFEADFRVQRQELERVCMSCDQEKLAEIAHRVAGGVGNLGLRRASAVFRLAERQAREGSFDRFGSLVGEVDAQIDLGLRTLRQYCA